MENVIGHKFGKEITKEQSAPYLVKAIVLRKELYAFRKELKAKTQDMEKLQPLIDRYHSLEGEYAKDYDWARFIDNNDHNTHVNAVNNIYQVLSQINKILGLGKYKHPVFWTYNKV